MEQTVVLVRSGTITGRVVDAATGRPVAGVPVLAAQGERRLRSSLEEDDPRAVSDASGRFVLAGARRGPVTVYAFGAGWLSDRLPDVDCTSGYDPLLVEVPAGGTVHRDLPVTPAGRVAGRITGPDGQALADARVRATQFDGSRGGCGSNAIMANDFPFVPDPPSVYTGSDGRYLIPTLLPGLGYQVDGTLEGFERGSERTRAASGETASLDLSLEAGSPAYYLELEVYDRETGKAIRGATAGHVTTDEQGFARIGPFRERRPCSVHAPGYFGSRLEVEPPDDLTGPRPTRRMVAHLDRAAAVAGRVLTPEGVPADGATVRLGEPVDLASPWHGTTDDVGPDGRFAFRELDPTGGNVRVFAAWECAGRVYRGVASAALGADDVSVSLALEPIDQARLPREIRVTDRAARPVATGYVRVHYQPAPHDPRMRPPVPWDSGCVADGAFLLAPSGVPFRIEIAEAALAAEPDAGRGAALGARLLGPFLATAAVPDAIVLSPARRIEGRVVDENGAPVPGLEVTAEVVREPWPEREQQPRSIDHASSLTDGDGRFVLDALGDFPYRVHVPVPSRWRRPEVVETAPGCAPLEIRLGSAHRCTVTVLDADGALLAGADFGLTYRGGSHGRIYALMPDVVTRADGRHILEGLDPEKNYALVVHPPMDRDDLAPAVIDPWAAVDTTVRLVAAVCVEGIVVDDEGRPVARACVNARPADEGAPAFYESDFTDEGGCFRLASVPPGRVRLVLECSPFHEPSTREIEVPCARLRLQAPEGLPVEIRMRPAPGSASRLVWRLLGPRWDGREAIRDRREPHGPAVLRLGHLPRGRTYDLLVERPGAGLVGRIAALSSDAGQVDLVLREGLTLNGRLLHPAGGRRVPDAKVTLRMGRQTWEVEGEADGSFRFLGLPPGTATLEARWICDGRRYKGRAEAEVGSGHAMEVPLAPTE